MTAGDHQKPASGEIVTSRQPAAMSGAVQAAWDYGWS
jgi:hypothetical protein